MRVIQHPLLSLRMQVAVEGGIDFGLESLFLILEEVSVLLLGLVIQGSFLGMSEPEFAMRHPISVTAIRTRGKAASQASNHLLLTDLRSGELIFRQVVDGYSRLRAGQAPLRRTERWLPIDGDPG